MRKPGPAFASAPRLASQRKRLALSGRIGRLLGVSAQTVYNWETCKTRPQAS
jgi:DNA-binding transcriptional regulator YiaG